MEAPRAKHYRFTHAIIPEVLRSDLSGKRLPDLHWQIASAIERQHRSQVDVHAADIAVHYERAFRANAGKAGRTPSARSRLKVVNYARRGANQAVKRLAYSEAARLYQMALDAIGDSRSNWAEHAAILFSLGEVLGKSGSWSQAREAFSEALSLSRKCGDAELQARAALASCGWSGTLFGTKVDTEVVALLKEALTAVGTRDSSIRASLLARLAQEMAADRREVALSLCKEAIEVARRLDDAGALVSALWTQHQLYWGPHDVEKRLDATSELIRLAEGASALDWALSAREFRLSALIELGRMEFADQEIESYAVLQERARTSSGAVECYCAMRCLMSGDFDVAERYALEGIATAARRGDQPLATAFGIVLIQIRIEQGRVAENEHLITEYAAQFPNLALPRCGLADLYAREGNQSKARQEFERLAADDFAPIPRDWNWICCLATLCGVCAFLRDERRGAILYDLLRPYAGRNVTSGWGDISYGSVDYYLGRLAVLMGRLDEAESHFDLALRFNERMGARPLVAHTRFECGRALLARARDRDHERALELLRQAQGAASALGMKDLEHRARALLAETLEHARPTGVSTAERAGDGPAASDRDNLVYRPGRLYRTSQRDEGPALGGIAAKVPAGAAGRACQVPGPPDP